MPSDGAKKRKACQACTRAKAKCSPYGDGDVCYRCQRLSKECMFEEAAKKRVPKTRSYVQELEQRVETLIDLIGVNGQPIDSQPFQPSNSTPATSASIGPVETSHPTVLGNTAYSSPEETSTNTTNNYGKSDAYDPIEAGTVSEHRASLLLNQFRNSFTLTFPFVVIPASANVDNLRRHRPFLFLAIMATMTFETPTIQHALEAEFKCQIASRVVRSSHKSLEILQGLLVYAASYHFFYKPKNQQLSVILQLCVAMTQGLNLTKDSRSKARSQDPTRDPRESLEQSSAEKRAFLGTFCVVTSFAQAFCKGSTMKYTRYMASCCRFLTENQEQPTDALIAPLIRMSELMSRINDFFSYDDIDYAIIKGDMVLEMSMANFCRELGSIKDTIPSACRQNKTLNLYICLLDMSIHECCLHSSLWVPSPNESLSSFSQARLTTLSRALRAMQTYLETFLATPQKSLYYLPFSAWSGWFYSAIVACKLVFLSCSEHSGQTNLDALPNERNIFLPNQTSSTNAPQISPNPQIKLWDPVSVAKEAGILDLFGRFLEKMKFNFPPEDNNWTDMNEDTDPLFHIACLQRSLHNGFNKKIKEYKSRTNEPTTNSTLVNPTQTPIARANPNDHATSSNISSHNTGPQINPIADYIQARAGRTTQNPYHGMTAPQSDAYRQHPGVPNDSHDEHPTAFLLDQMRKYPIPGVSTFKFNSINFDSVEFNNDEAFAGENVDMGGMDAEEEVEVTTSGYDDWVWNSMMQDFGMPGI